VKFVVRLLIHSQKSRHFLFQTETKSINFNVKGLTRCVVPVYRNMIHPVFLYSVSEGATKQDFKDNVLI
jgi:hypothetical protein